MSTSHNATCNQNIMWNPIFVNENYSLNMKEINQMCAGTRDPHETNINLAYNKTKELFDQHKI